MVGGIPLLDSVVSHSQLLFPVTTHQRCAMPLAHSLQEKGGWLHETMDSGTRGDSPVRWLFESPCCCCCGLPYSREGTEREGTEREG